MIILYTDNFFLREGLHHILNPAVIIHSNSSNFREVFYSHYSNFFTAEYSPENIVIIDSRSAFFSWFNIYNSLEAERKAHFVFYGACKPVDLLAGRYKSISTDSKAAVVKKLLCNPYKIVHTPNYVDKNILTQREKEIIYSTLAGMDVRTISKTFGLSVKTVYHYRQAACKKLGVRKAREFHSLWKELCP